MLALAVGVTCGGCTVKRTEDDRELAQLADIAMAAKVYYSHYNRFPNGGSAEVSEALLGQNPDGISFFIPSDRRYVSIKNEICDRWGQPATFFFAEDQAVIIWSVGENGVWDGFVGNGSDDRYFVIRANSFTGTSDDSN